MRKLLLALFALAFVVPAQAQNYQATQGSGTTFGTKLVGGVNYPQWVLCDPTTPANCASVNGSGQLSIGVASGAVAPGAYGAGSYAAGALVAGAMVDGADVTQGFKADAACATSSSVCSISSLLHGILGGVQGPYPLNVNGTVTAQTGVTPGVAQTGTKVAANTDITSVGGTAVPKGGVPVISGASAWNTIAASQTAQVLSSTQAGGTGAVGDYLSHCVAYPTSTSPGVITVFDGTNTATNDVIAFPGGASSLSNLAPFSFPVGAVSVNSGGWKVTTGANIFVSCYGKFT